MQKNKSNGSCKILGLAPMDGITDCACRLLYQDIFSKYGKHAEFWSWTEFMNADGYCINPPRLIRHMITVKNEFPTIAQIYGGDETTLIKAAKDIEQKYGSYFSGIELNVGCPSPKVMAGGAGSGMMKDKNATLNIMKNIKKNISLPFSIKTRIGIDEADKNKQFEFLLAASEFCDKIVLHGRTLKQSHSGSVDREYILRFKQQANPKCKIIGNGGISGIYEKDRNHEFSPLDSKILDILDGVMVGQDAIGNPRIFTDHVPDREELFATIRKHYELVLCTELYFEKHKFDTRPSELQTRHFRKDAQNEYLEKFASYVFPMPTLEDIMAMKEFIDDENDYCQKATLEFRKYFFGYIKGIVGNKELKIRASEIKKPGEFIRLIVKSE